MEKSTITRQIIAGFTATMSSFIAGFHYGWFAPTVPKLLADDSDVNITSDESVWIMNFLTVGNAFGAFIAMAVINRWGRKLLLLLSSIPHLISAILLGIAQHFWVFVIARFIGGLAIGMAFGTVPIYLGEIAEDRIRGALCTLTFLMLHFGSLVTYCIGPWVGRISLACFGGVLPIIFVLIFFWMPESPYFLMMKQQPDKTEKCLLWLRGIPNVKEELENIRKNIESDKSNTGSVKDLFVGHHKAFIIIVGLALAQHLTGIGPILAYSTLIFEASAATLNSSISLIIVGIVQVSSVIMATFTVDLAGRRPLLMLSAGGLIVPFAGGALYFQLQAAGVDVNSFTWIPMISVIAIVILYSVGIGSLSNIILVEILPISLKAPALLTILVVSSCTSIAVMKIYQIVADAYGIHTAFWGFATISAFAGIFIYFVVPETKQKSFMEIQNELRRNTESSTV